MQDFIENVWYMTAWASEVDETLLSRRLLGEPILITRTASGEPLLLRDRCPHRFAPLSRGRRDGDTIVCGYHGLAFGPDGHCVRNPYSGRLPTGALVRRYPAVERDGIIWGWFGAEESADAANIPDFSMTAAGPAGTTINGHTLMAANYEFGTDNLLDLSHIEFVHTGTFAGNGVIFQGEHEVLQEGQQIHSNWWMPGVACPGGFRDILQREIVDHWLDMRWDAPASMYLQVGATAPGAPREAGAALHQAHILTPATANETHYFWSSNAQYPLPPERAESLRDMLQQAFDVEDKPMIEAAFANADGKFWELQPLSLGIDAAGARARRMIQSIKRRESTARDSA